MHVSVGDKVQDSLTALVGIVTCRSEYLFGCVRVQVQPQALDKDGLPSAVQVFDEAQLTVLEKQKFLPFVPHAGDPPGGPREETRRAPETRRADDDRR